MANEAEKRLMCSTHPRASKMIVNIIKTILEISFFALLLLPLTACGPQQQQPSERGKQLVKAATAYKTSQLVKPQPTVTVVGQVPGRGVRVRHPDCTAQAAVDCVSGASCSASCFVVTPGVR